MRETRGSNGIRNNKISNGIVLGASIQARIDFSDNPQFLGSLLTNSAPADWTSALLAILLEVESVLTAELTLTAALEKDVADIACTLDSLSSKLSIPLF